MRVIFAGSPAFAVPCLERLLLTAHETVAVVTQPDRPAGRGLKLKACPVKEFALERGVEVHTPDKFNTRSFREVLSGLKPDLMVVVAYGKIFRRKALALPRLGCVNLHASLLPKYRGVRQARSPGLLSVSSGKALKWRIRSPMRNRSPGRRGGPGSPRIP